MRNRKRSLFLWAVLMSFIAVICFAGCSNSPKTRSEKQIAEDLAAHSFFVNQYSEYKITNLEVSKRQTDIDNKTDIVYAIVNIIKHDEAIEGKLDVIITYGLYNEGWILDACELNYEGENGGSLFTPLIFTELTSEEIRTDVSMLINQEWESIEIINIQWDSENMQRSVLVFGDEIGTYLSSRNEALVYYNFDQMYGTWWCSDVSIKNREEKWNVVGTYGIDTRNRDGIEIAWNTIEVGLPVHYFAMNDTDYSWDHAVVDICNIHSDDFTKFLSEALTEWKNRSFSEISDYGYTVEITGDFYSLDPFEYAVYWDGAGNRNDHMLFLGKNDIAYFWANDFEDDWYQRRAILDVYRLVPIY